MSSSAPDCLYCASVSLRNFQRSGEFGLLEQVAWLVIVPVAQENTLGLGKLGEVLVSFEILHVFVGEREAVASKLDGWSYCFFDRQLAILFFCINESCHGTGNGDCLVSNDAGLFAGSRNDIALSIQIHGLSGCRGRLFPEVDEAGFAVRIAKKHEAAAAKIPGLGMDDREREPGGNGSIHRIAAGMQHFNAGARGKFMNAGHDGMRSMGGA